MITRGVWCLALTAVLIPGAAHTAAAAVYLTPSQAAERLLPPHDEIRKVYLSPTDEQKQWLAQRLGYVPPRTRYIWRVAKQQGTPVGYMLIDNEVGKHEPITFAVTLDAVGSVTNVAVCVYRETRGGEIRRPSFTKQFFGRRFGDRIRLDHEISHISGATLSSRSAVVVVNRALALWALEFNPPPAGQAETGE